MLPPITEDALPTDAELKSCERQLRRAGLPLLIEGYSAAEDIFTRALPFLGLVALLEVLGALNLDWGPVANVAALVGGGVLLVVAYGVLNLLMGRPFAALPHRMGVPELAAFVTLPALLPMVFGGQFAAATGTALGNLCLLALVWLVIGFGLLSIVRWAAARLFAQLAASLTLLVRALPLILFFGLVTFFTTEIWQLFSTISTQRYIALVIFFLAIGVLFLTVRLPYMVNEVESSVELAGRPLRRPQRINLGLVILASQALQILLVTLSVWVFFAVSGALLVDVSVIETWTGKAYDKAFTMPFFDDDIVVTKQLLWATFGIAAFSGLYYTVGMLVDSTYRDEFVGELTDQMRSTFKIRANYLSLLSSKRAAETGERVLGASSPGN